MSHKNAALAFDKLNSCLQDVQKWMSSSMLKLNPDSSKERVDQWSCIDYIYRKYGAYGNATVYLRQSYDINTVY